MNEILGQIMLSLASFPSFSKAGSKALKLLNQIDAKIEEVVNNLRYDPGLTANVLKLANSPFYGIPQKVGSLKQATILLGTKRLAKLVIAVCANALMEKKLHGYDLPSGYLWRHSIEVSSIAETVAKFVKLDDSVDVFTPGLLHDLGKIALNNFVVKRYDQIKKIASTGVPLELAEHMVLGTDHAEIGSQILRHWSFPMAIVDAVRFHHNPDRLKIQNNQLDVVYIANFLCKSKARDNSNLNLSGYLSQNVIKRLGINSDDLKLLYEKIQELPGFASES